MTGVPEATEAARRARVLARQRARRQRVRRIDYAPDHEARAILEEALVVNPACTVSGLLDAILVEWRQFRKAAAKQ